MVTKTVKLSNGADMPLLGFGTWECHGENGVKAVEKAIDVGYRLIDCAWINQNEELIGRAIGNKIAQGVLERGELFVVTKVHGQFYRRPDVKLCLLQSLEKLGLNYVDLLLVHGPVAVKKDPNYAFPTINGKIATEVVDHLETWKGMEDVYKEGLAKAIGLSNYNSQQIQRIYDHSFVKPMAVQVECHAYYPQHDLIGHCRRLAIFVMGFSPLGSPGRSSATTVPGLDKLSAEDGPLKDPKVMELARKKDVTEAQILLRWQVQRDVTTIPKSITPSRIEENFNIWNFELSRHEMAILSNLGINRSVFKPAFESHIDHPDYPFSEDS